MKTAIALFSIAIIAGAANSADERQFENPLSDNGHYLQYAFKIEKLKRTLIHVGKDYNNNETTIIKAAGSGRIVSKVSDGAGDHRLGNTLIIVHPATGLGFTPIYSLYAHLDSFATGANLGAYVSKGQQIATMGKTGKGSNGITHLHFEFKTSNSLASIAGNEWGYIADNSTQDLTQLRDAGFRDPADIIGNTGVAYSEFKLTTALPTSAYRNQGFAWNGTLENPFASSSDYDVRLILETTSGGFLGVIGEELARTAQANTNQAISITKPSFATPAGTYRVRLEHRGAAIGGPVWTTTPTQVGGKNPSEFVLY